MPDQSDISRNYTHGRLVGAIEDALKALGKTPDTITLDDLAPVDEFHIGGRMASEDFLGQLTLSPGDRVVDVGCGLGGAARFAASRFGCQVTGIDLTGEYIETGQVLTRWVGLEHRVSLHHGSALAMPFAEGGFDAAYMFHVGMNIDDKAALFAEIARVLRPGGLFGIYDVMQISAGALTYPVPWASTDDICSVAAPKHYKALLDAAGFTIVGERSRRDFALDFFTNLRASASASSGPPPLGLHVLMGKSTAEKLKNMVTNITAGHIAPVELIARKI